MADYQLLSIIIPAYNERTTVGECIRRVREAPLGIEREIIVVDDGSDDGTLDIVKRLANSGSPVCITGKGSCIAINSRDSC